MDSTSFLSQSTVLRYSNTNIFITARLINTCLLRFLEQSSPPPQQLTFKQLFNSIVRSPVRSYICSLLPTLSQQSTILPHISAKLNAPKTMALKQINFLSSASNVTLIQQWLTVFWKVSASVQLATISTKAFAHLAGRDVLLVILKIPTFVFLVRDQMF